MMRSIPDSQVEKLAQAGSGVVARRRERLQLSEEVASYIRDLIMCGRVSPNEYLRIDRLADELGVSTTSAREALLSMRAEGFVELDRNRGFRVPSLSRQD